MFEHSSSKEIFPVILYKPHLAQFDAVSSRRITCYLGKETDLQLCTTPAVTAEGSEERSDRLSPVPAPVTTHWRWWRAWDHGGASQRGLAVGAHPGHPLPEPGGGEQPRVPGAGPARGRSGGCSGGCSGGFPEGAGRASGRALPKGGALGEHTGTAPSLHPSLPSSAGLEPPLGSAPSSSPLGNAGPSPSSRFRWQELGPCPALPSLRRSPGTRPHPARPRTRGEPGARGGGGCGPFPAPGEGREGTAGRGRPGAGVSGCRPGRWRCRSRRDRGAGAPWGEECSLQTIPPAPPPRRCRCLCLCDFCGNRKVSCEG